MLPDPVYSIYSVSVAYIDRDIRDSVGSFLPGRKEGSAGSLSRQHHDQPALCADRIVLPDLHRARQTSVCADHSGSINHTD